MADVKVSGIPPDTGLDDNHYVILNDPVGPTTKTTTLGVLRAWLQSVTAWVKSSMVDYSTFALNMKGSKNTSTVTPINGSNVSGGAQGSQVTFTVAAACQVYVQVNAGVISSSDFEYRLLIFLDGVNQTGNVAVFPAATGNASSRVFERSVTGILSLSAGAHTLAAGIFVSSATGPSIPIEALSIHAIVLGNVTA